MAVITEVFVYTMNRGVQGGAWSRYVFPWQPEHFAHLDNDLYIRHGDIVAMVDYSALDDSGQNFDGTIQWPWLDFGKPGALKQLIGFDIQGIGTSSISFGYDQSNFGTFTASYAIPADTVPGYIIPYPIAAPSLSAKLVYDGGQAWEWNGLQLHLNEQNIPQT